MNPSGKNRLLIVSVTIVSALVITGCATRKYARTQASVVNQRLSQVQAETNTKLTKQQGEISYVNERLTSTNNALAAVANTAQQASASAAQANTAAGQAMEQAQSTQAELSTTSTQVKTNASDLEKLASAQNYTLTETGNVTFRFNQSELTNEAKAALDVLIQKAAAQPRTMLEVEGFTDQIGSKSYNLELSQKRAEAVARYLVQQNIPLKNISIIGLGEEQAPEQLVAEFKAIDPNVDTKDLKSLARRVRIRVYSPGGETPQAAGANQSGGPPPDVAQQDPQQ